MAKKPSTSKVTLVAGLRWLAVTAPTGSRDYRKQLREHAEALDAQGFASNPKDPGIVGLQPSRRRGNAHSLAVVALSFAESAKASSAASVEDLNTHLPDLGVAVLLMGEGNVCSLVIVANDGILVDKEGPQSACFEQIQTVCQPGSPWVLYTNANVEEMAEAFPGLQVEHVEVSDLIAIAAESKASLIQGIPRSRTPIVVALTATLLSVVAAGWYLTVAKPDAEKRARLAALGADNTDAYILAADAELKRGGWDRSDLASRLAEVAKLPISSDGWHAKEVTCELASETCRLSLARAGGTSSALTAGWGDFKFVPTQAQIESAVLEGSFPAKRAGLERGQIQANHHSQLALQPIAQQLINAGLTFKATEASRWAALTLDGVDASSVLSRFQVEVSGPLYRAQEVLELLPPSVLLSSASVNLASVSSDNPQVNFIVKGHVYVK